MLLEFLVEVLGEALVVLAEDEEEELEEEELEEEELEEQEPEQEELEE